MFTRVFGQGYVDDLIDSARVAIVLGFASNAVRVYRKRYADFPPPVFGSEGVAWREPTGRGAMGSRSAGCGSRPVKPTLEEREWARSVRTAAPADTRADQAGRRPDPPGPGSTTEAVLSTLRKR